MQPDSELMNSTAQSPDIRERTGSSFKLDDHHRHSSHKQHSPPLLTTSQLQTFCFQPIIYKHTDSSNKKQLSDSVEALQRRTAHASGSPKKRLMLIQKILLGGSREKLKQSSPQQEATAARPSSKEATKQTGLKSLHEYDISRLRRQVPTVNHLRQKIK